MIHWALRRSGAPPLRGGEHRGDATAPGGGRDDACLTRAERVRLHGFRVPKRRADWLAGRVTAKGVVARAMQEVLPGRWPLASIEIASEPSGAPWARLAREAAAIAGYAPGERLPISVSISHAEDHALCAATCAPQAPARSAVDGEDDDRCPAISIGADLGAVEPRSPAFVETFFTPDERRFVQEGPASERDLRANLVWCAKEAVLKALGLGLTVDTLELSCLPAPCAVDLAAWPMSPPDGAWRPFVTAFGPALARDGRAVRGVSRVFPGFVGALAMHG